MAKRHAGGRSRAECEARGTLADLMRRYPDEEACEERLLQEMFLAGFLCPRCGCTTCSKVRGHAHKWQCTRCSRQFSVTKGTMMERTHLPLTGWFMAIWLVANSRRGMSAAELQTFVGCSYRSAEYLLGRIRCAMSGSECLLCARCGDGRGR